MAKIKKSVVKSVTANGTWESKREPIKTFYKHQIEMENGDIGEYSSIAQEQDKFVVGTEVEYEYTAGEFPKIKPHYSRQDSTSGGGYNVEVSDKEQYRIARSVAIKIASEQAIHHKLAINQMLLVADSFATYIVTGEIIRPEGIADYSDNDPKPVKDEHPF